MHPLLDQQQKEVTSPCRHAGARRRDAFGSLVRADFDPARSDLDFLVEFDNAPPTTHAQAYFALKGHQHWPYKSATAAAGWWRQ